MSRLNFECLKKCKSRWLAYDLTNGFVEMIVRGRVVQCHQFEFP
jgi:hypothetical protein